MSKSDKILEVLPSEVRFQYHPNKNLTTQLVLTNKTQRFVAYKVKTTAPKNYTVKPNIGYLSPSEKVTLDIIIFAGAGASFSNDKFLVIGKECDDKSIPVEEFFKMPAGQSNVFEQKLRVYLNKTPETIPEESLRSSSASNYKSAEKEDLFKSTLPSKINDNSEINLNKNDEQKQTMFKSMIISNEKSLPTKDLFTKNEELMRKIEEKEKQLLKVSEERNKYKQQTLQIQTLKEKSGGISVLSALILAIISIVVGYLISNKYSMN